MSLTTTLKSVSQIFVELVFLIFHVLVIYGNSLRQILFGSTRKQVQNQVILITGSGHGLGRQLALMLSRLDAKLVLLDVNQDNNNKVLEEIKKEGGLAIGFKCDITDEESVKNCVNSAVAHYGTIDILINNAGITNCVPIDQLSARQIRKNFEVNVISHFWTIKASLPFMLEKKSGHIVAISSIAGLIGTAYLTDYCATKHAIVGLMKALDVEIHKDGNNEDIHLTTVCPLAMSTGMFHNPKSRFNHLLPIISPEMVAERTIEAMLQNKSIITVPGFVEAIYRFGHIVPVEAVKTLESFLNYGVEPHSF